MKFLYRRFASIATKGAESGAARLVLNKNRTVKIPRAEEEVISGHGIVYVYGGDILFGSGFRPSGSIG